MKVFIGRLTAGARWAGIVWLTAAIVGVADQPPGAEDAKGEPYTSGCTHVLTLPSVVYPGDIVTVTAKAYQGGVCGSSWVWMSFAVDVEIDGEPGPAGGSQGIYDFCYWGDPQPIVYSGVGSCCRIQGRTP